MTPLPVRAFRASDFELELPDLPHGLEEARHILDLEALRWALWALAALVVVLLAYRWLRRLRQRAEVEPPTPEPAPMPVPMSLPRVVTRILDLRDRHLSAGTFRQGCHELAALLRSHYESLWHEPLETKTAREIRRLGARRIGAQGGGAPGHLFGELEGLQFARREPTADDLETVCDLAADVTSGETLPSRETPGESLRETPQETPSGAGSK